MFTMVECHRSRSRDRVRIAKSHQPGSIRDAMRKDYLRRRFAYGPDNEHARGHGKFWSRTRRWNGRKSPKRLPVTR